MAMSRGISRVFIVLLISMAVLWPLFQASRARNLLAEEVFKETETFGKKIETNAMAIEVQGRQVPTGPDPLHHNRNPTSP